MQHEHGALGKRECWYILDCTSDAKIVVGHYAKTKQELMNRIEKKEWDHLLRTIPIHPGDFFEIEPGTIHAIQRGTLLLETQQNSDITYRLYDYGRLQNGKPRTLHIKQCMDVITCPYQISIERYKESNSEHEIIQPFISCDSYTVNKLSIHGNYDFDQNHLFTLNSVIAGRGNMDGISIKEGDHFILPYDYGTYRVSGNLELISSYVR